MDAASSLLPEITAHHTKPRRSAQCSRMKTLQTGSAPVKPARILCKAPASQARNRLKQNVCVELLRQGYHRSFSELFYLLATDRDRRAAAEPGSAARLQAPLEDQRDKLETLKLHLIRAEQAERTGLPALVCEQRLVLVRFFSSPEDVWIRSHFCHSCIAVGGASRPATEARACLAELYLLQGELQRARQQAERCLQQAEDGDWLDSSGRPLRTRADQSLWRIYSRLADALLDTAEHGEALVLLHKGLSMAHKTGDKQMEGEASYRLGLTYQRAGDHDSSNQFFNRCVQVCILLQDAEGQVKAYNAMAKSLDSQGHTHEMVQCLEKLADVSRSNGLQHSLADAYLSLGNIYYKRSQLQRAAALFLRGYDVTRQLEDEVLRQRAQVLVGVTRAHSMIRKYGAEVQLATPTGLRQLLAWRQSRTGQDLSPDSIDQSDRD